MNAPMETPVVAPPYTTAGEHRIVIVGGGAGGLELATRLGDTLGKKGRAQIVLIDRQRTHMWKPLLHQVAAGRLDMGDNATEYAAQARWHHFRFIHGAMEGLDRAAHRVHVAATRDRDGRTITPARAIAYDTLIIAVGSTVNDFGTPGVAEHAIKLDSTEHAEYFNEMLINACIRANTQSEPLRPGQLQVGIVGAGATGVELAAELRKSFDELSRYGLSARVAEQVRLRIIEAGPRILPGLPEDVADGVRELLEAQGVDIRVAQAVTALTEDGMSLADGTQLPCELMVWAAGVKAPAVLARLDGLQTNKNNQIQVHDTLQSITDEDIFAFGDCAACPMADGALVPPRAQSAHQQARLLEKTIAARLQGDPLPRYRYRDFGSVLGLGDRHAIGTLMGGLIGGRVKIHGLVARWTYILLYKQHLLALHGWLKPLLDTIARALLRQTEPHVKLH